MEGAGQKAEKQFEIAKAALKEFEESGKSERLDKLKRGRVREDYEGERKELEDEKKKLEDKRDLWESVWADALRAPTAAAYQLQRELVLAEQHPSEIRRKRWRALNEILANKRAKKSSDKESSAYSSIAWTDVKEVFKPFKKYCQKTSELPDNSIDLLYNYTSLAVNCLGAISTGKEAKRLHFIAPILILVCSNLDNVEILVEEDMDGKNIQVNGRFEFIIQRAGKRVCIVEAKKDDLEQGLAQDLLGCEAVADIERLNCVYGIVTNYKEWIFLRSFNNRIEYEETTITFDDNMPTQKSLAKIAGKISAMLSRDSDEE